MTWEVDRTDCLGRNGLRKLLVGEVDHTITDPPFGAEAHQKRRRVVTGKGKSRKLRHAPMPFLPLGRAEISRASYEIARVTRRWIVVFCQPEDLHLWRAGLVAGGAVYVRSGVWVPTDGKPNFRGNEPGQGHWSLVIAHGALPKGERRRWNGGGKPAVYRTPKGTYQEGVSGQLEKLHPAGKPLALMRDLVRDFTDVGEKILDPFAGAGTTGVAALAEGRTFIGMEKDRKWAGLAQRVLAGEEARPDPRPPSLFDRRAA